MERIITRPGGLDLESPGRRDYWVALEHDSIWGDHLIPLTVMVGPNAKPSQGLVAFGSNHGNEYEGPVAVKHLLRDIDVENVQGRIILVPVLNPAAFRAGTRDSTLDDNRNLNRCFVDGVLQGEAPLAYTPQGPGRTSVGVRNNRVSWFNGALREARFTHEALPPRRFTRPA